MPVDRRLLSGAIATRLLGVANAAGYYGQIGRGLDGTLGGEPQPKSSDDPRIAPYFVFYPGAGGDGPDLEVAQLDDDITQGFSITAVAGDVDDLLALVNRINARIYLWSPTVAGHVCGRITYPLGFQPSGHLVDRQFEPNRLYVPMQYQLTATT